MNNLVPVHSGSLLFPASKKHKTIPYGSTIRQIIDFMALPERYHPYLRVFLGGQFVPMEYWDRVKPKAGKLVDIAIAPAGDIGKGTWRALATVIPTLVESYFVKNPVLQMGLYLLNQWIATSLIPAPDDTLENNSYSVSASSNQIRKYECVPKVYGRTRIYPPLAAMPYTEIVGNDQYINLLFCLGYKPLHISDLRIGETPINKAVKRNDVSIHYDDGWDHVADDVVNFNNDIYEEIIDKTLEYADGWIDTRTIRDTHENIITYTTQAETIGLSIDISFPRGLYEKISEYVQDDYGRHVDLAIRYRTKDATRNSDWIYVIPLNAIDTTADVVTFTDSDVWQWLIKYNIELGNMIAQLNAIATAERLVSIALREAVLATLTETQRLILAATEDVVNPLTGEELTTLEGIQQSLMDLSEIVDAASTFTDEVAENLNVFHGIISGVILLGQFIDGFIRLGMYNKAGTGPPLETLGWWQRFLIHWFGHLHPFEELGAGEFRILSEQAYRGILRRSFFVPVPEGQYDIQIRRCTPEPTEAEDGKVFDECHVYAIRSIQSGEAISDTAKEKCAFLSMRIKASERMNGTIQQFNCLAESPLEWYDGSEWRDYALVDDSGNKVSRNPAWQYCDVLRGNAIKKVIDDDRLDMTRILELAESCNQNQYYFDFVFDKSDTVQKALNDICRVAKATPLIRDGYFSLVQDKKRSTPYSLITLRDCRDFQGSKAFKERPQALRIKFQNEEADYQQDERIIYDDTHSATIPPEVIEEMDIVGVTNPDHVYKLGRYLIACARLRPEVFEVTMDFERLSFERGDMVYLQHDINMWGKGSGRITGLSKVDGGDGFYRVYATIDEDPAQWDWTESNQIRIRRSNELSHLVLPVFYNTEYPDALMFYYVEGFDTWYETLTVGDLFAIGKKDSIAIGCIVKEIQPKSELTAKITLIECANAVHNAETGEIIPEFDANITKPYVPELSRPPRPHILRIDAGESAALHNADGSLTSRIMVSIDLPQGRTETEKQAASMVTGIEAEYRLSTGETDAQDNTGLLNDKNVISKYASQWHSNPTQTKNMRVVYFDNIEDLREYDIRIRSVTRYGVPSEWAYSFRIFVTGKTGLPPNVYDLRWDYNTLSWNYNTPSDHAGFLVRFAHGEISTWDLGTPAHKGLLKESVFQVPPEMNGITLFMVKAVDLSGNESYRAASILKDLGLVYVGRESDRAYYYDIMEYGVQWSYENMEVNESFPMILQAIEYPKISFYCDNHTGTPFYRKSELSELPFYSTIYPECSVTSDLFEHSFIEGESVFPDIRFCFDSYYGAPIYKIEYRSLIDNLWPESLDEDLWPEGIMEYFWPEAVYWTTYRGKIKCQWENAGESAGFQFRIVAPAQDIRFAIDRFDIVYGYDYLTEYHSDFIVSDSGNVYLPYEKNFSTFTDVIITVQFGVLKTGEVPRATDVDKNHNDTDNKLGPSVILKDSLGVRVGGAISYTLIGY